MASVLIWNTTMAHPTWLTPVDQLTIADRLAAARRHRFVGRELELKRFADALNTSPPPFAVLFVHGPGGIGKSTLLEEYRRLATEAGRRTVIVDGRSCEPSPPGVLRTIATALGMTSGENGPGDMCAPDGLLLMFDSYEQLRPLDAWLRDELLPMLPATALTVIAGRMPPEPGWRASPGWNDLIEVQSLRNLEPVESRTYLERRGVPEAFHAAAVAFTHGHPLALSLVGDVALRSTAPFQPGRDPDVVTSLLARFVESVPSSMHRLALDVCAHARVTTESLLAHVVGEPEAQLLFDWLYGLSFIEHNQSGVFPHDLVRDVLVSELRWRHPERFRDIHRKVHDYFINRVRTTHGREQFDELYNLMFLHRENPSWQQFAQTDRYGHEYMEPATGRDYQAIVDMVRAHEGGESAEIAAEWLRLQPEAFMVLRDAQAEITGIVVPLMVGRYTRDEITFDPIVAAAHDLMEREMPLRPGEEAMCVRYCMDREAYRTDATRTHFAMASAPIVYTHPALMWGVFPVPDPDFWKPIFDYLCFQRFPEADDSFFDRRWSFFGSNFRLMPIDELDRILTEREISLSPELEPPAAPVSPALAVLSEPEFRQAVRQALRDYHRADALAKNPLCYSRLVVERDAADSVTALRELLDEAIDRFDAGPRTRRYHAVLTNTYVNPARTQEEAAELLGLPFSTYRRYLTTGIDHVSGELWRRELCIADPRTRQANK